MLNTLYLPELRELLAENNDAELASFCVALHPARTAEFMEGLTAAEAWAVLLRAEIFQRTEIFSYFERDKQVEIAESQQREEIANLIAAMPPDDRVDLLREMSSTVVTELLPLLPADERRDILRLRAYPEGSAGALMTTEFAKLGEQLTVHEALEELGQQAEELETINYLYVVDIAQDNQLRGVLSARQLLSAIARPHTHLADLMERDLVTVNVLEDQEQIANKVAHFDLMAIPVIDDTHRMVGIITHDDVIDVMREEATEDAHRIAAVDPLKESYLDTGLLTLTWKRGIWLTVLFLWALVTAVALRMYEGHHLSHWPWLVAFIPLIISSGGNSGNQTATLVITGLATGDVRLADWHKVFRREIIVGMLLGVSLALIGFVVAWVMRDGNIIEATVLPCTLLLIVLCGTIIGAGLPLMFYRLGGDPALMSNPFVAGIIDIVGIVIYMSVAAALLG
ncbi:MAG: magnesium transporter [Pirellulaceae bacterium]|nr:magnesium transporter [Pirellulaceae bacterium]